MQGAMDALSGATGAGATGGQREHGIDGPSGGCGRRSRVAHEHIGHLLAADVGRFSVPEDFEIMRAEMGQALFEGEAASCRSIPCCVEQR